MARSIDQVHDIILSVQLPSHANRLHFDGNAPLTLKLHGVKHLGHHFAGFYGMGDLKHAVCKRRFAMVDMGDNAEIPDVHELPYLSRNWIKINSCIDQKKSLC